MIIALVLAVATWCFWPVESAFWRKAAAVTLAVGLGYHIARAILTRDSAPAAKLKNWLECPAFLLVMAAFYYLPAAYGWLLLLTGWAWRFLVQNLWKA